MSRAWWSGAPRSPDREAEARARARQDQLTKPRGSLGRLEDTAVILAGLQGRSRPQLEHVRIVVFAADHGIAARGVSAYPQSVTNEMLRNFARGGAAINVLARQLGAELEVVDVGSVSDPGPLHGVVSRRVRAGSMDFCSGPAMSEAEMEACLAAGREAVERAARGGAQLFIGGEMGIGNTTAAAAVACAILGVAAASVVGPGTGVTGAGLARKVELVEQGLARHALPPNQPWQALRCVGGLEVAALAGAYLACAQAGLPALVDGFIAGVAALAAVRLNPATGDWLLYAHRSAEPGHSRVLEALGAQPLLDLGLRLGEGSGAAAAVPLLRLAVALHTDMATFQESGVSDHEGGLP